jgi:hypothetical protein
MENRAASRALVRKSDMLNVPFTPGQTLTLAVTAASAPASFNAANADATAVEFLNAGLNPCFVVFGSTATTAGYPIGAGQRRVISKPAGVVQFAAICNATLSTTLYATAGQGV